MRVYLKKRYIYIHIFLINQAQITNLEFKHLKFLLVHPPFTSESYIYLMTCTHADISMYLCVYHMCIGSRTILMNHF